MPDWGRILGEIRESLQSSAREAQARERARNAALKRQAASRREEAVARKAASAKQNASARQSPPKQVASTYEPTECLFWSCETPIREDYIFCYPHFQDLQAGLIDECPGCGKAKSNEYEMCIPCNKRVSSRYGRRSYSAAAKKSQWYKPEYSEAWNKADAKAERFFAYILKLEDGQFYAGQTRELRERLSEHRDGRVKYTAGKKPKQVWFTSVDSRESATAIEVELKKLVDSNPRKIRRMILGYQDLVREFDFG